MSDRIFCSVELPWSLEPGLIGRDVLVVTTALYDIQELQTTVDIEEWILNHRDNKLNVSLRNYFS